MNKVNQTLIYDKFKENEKRKPFVRPSLPNVAPKTNKIESHMTHICPKEEDELWFLPKSKFYSISLKS